MSYLEANENLSGHIYAKPNTAQGTIFMILNKISKNEKGDNPKRFIDKYGKKQ